MADDRVVYDIIANDGATPVLKKVNKSFNDTDKGATKMGASMVAAGTLIADGAKMAMSAIYELGKATLEEADDFRKFGTTVGLTAAEVAGLDRSFSLAGSSTEGMKSAMLNLSAALDPTKVTKQRAAIEALGVSVTNSDGTMKTHQQLLMDVADAYNAETSEVKKAAIGKRIFGAESQKVSEVLSQGSAELSRQQKLYGDASGYTQEYAGQLESFNDALLKVKISVMGVLTSLGDSALFKTAIGYISDLSDEWVQFLADLKGSDIADKVADDFERTTEVQEKYFAMLKRSGTYGVAENAIAEGRKLAGAAIAEGTRASEILAAEQLALRDAIKYYKENGVAKSEVAKAEEELNRLGAKRSEELKKETMAAQAAAAAEKKLKEVKGVKDEAPKKAEKEPEYRTFDASNMMEKRRQDAEAFKNQRNAEREESRRLDAEYAAWEHSLKLEAMTQTDRERQITRDWYEEQKNLHGENAALDAAYAVRIEADKEAARVREIEHLEKVQEMEMQRLENMNLIAQATFDFLHTAVDGYKTLGGIAKGVAYAEAWWNTYVGFTKALATYGPIMGPVLGALTLAKGAAMTAKINSQKFKDGGIVGGSSYYGDANPVYANSGEMFMNKDMQSNLYNMLAGKSNSIERLREQNAGSSKSINFTINGILDNNMIRRINSMSKDALARA